MGGRRSPGIPCAGIRGHHPPARRDDPLAGSQQARRHLLAVARPICRRDAVGTSPTTSRRNTSRRALRQAIRSSGSLPRRPPAAPSPMHVHWPRRIFRKARSTS